MKYHLVLNETGNFVADVFYHVKIPFENDQEEGWRRAGGIGDQWEMSDYANIISMPDWIHACARFPEHEVGASFEEPDIELFEYKKSFAIIPSDGDGILCRETLRDALTKVPLVGVDITKAIDRGESKGKFPLYFVFGRNAPERIYSVVDHPNSCYKCGLGPVYCESCGSMMAICRNCGELAAVAPASNPESVVGTKQLYFDSSFPPQKGVIVDGRRWDGSDLMHTRIGLIMSKRLLNLLERSHFGLLHVRDVRFCTDHMTTKQLEWCQRAKTLFL